MPPMSKTATTMPEIKTMKNGLDRVMLSSSAASICLREVSLKLSRSELKN